MRLGIFVSLLLASAFVRAADADPDSFVSPEVAADGTVTFRVYAPDAHEVHVDGEFLRDGETLPLHPAANGVWSGRTSRAIPGTHRYTFNVDGLEMTDPRNVEICPTQTTVMSLVHVDGEATILEDERPVPHGSVAKIHYRSATFGADRQMHVYTPPGYEKDGRSYPVLYLLHGRGDADASWSTVGRAGFILDNLIAAGKAVPMIVVMPAGHAPPIAGGGDNRAAQALITTEIWNDVLPYVETHYRVLKAPGSRAVAGLSMGGNQAATLGLAHLSDFAYLGIFSAGLSAAAREQFESRPDDLKAAAKLKVLWVGYGDTDFVRDNARALADLFTHHGLHFIERETPGGHEWATWRQHFEEFAPLLFR